MHRTAFSMAALLVAIALKAHAEPVPAWERARFIDDFLEPTSPSVPEVPSYAIERTIPFDCGRYVEDQEGVLSIYRIPNTSRYRATVVIPVTNSVPRSDWLYPRGRHEADLPESCALAVREAWHAMLSRPYSQKRNEDKPVILDGLLAEYSLKVGPFRTIRGMVPNAGDRKYLGPHIRRFMDLSRLLFDYCRVSPRQRARLARKIDQAARELTESVKGKKRSNQALQPTPARFVSLLSETSNVKPVVELALGRCG